MSNIITNNEQFNKFDEGEHSKVLPCSPQMWAQLTNQSKYELKNGQIIKFTKLEYAPHEDAGKFTFVISKPTK